MSYVNLKNNATLTHSTTSKIITCNLIPNAIGNAYLVKDNDTCLDFINNKIQTNECDELIDSQLFSIIFTGNKATSNIRIFTYLCVTDITQMRDFCSST